MNKIRDKFGKICFICVLNAELCISVALNTHAVISVFKFLA